MLAGNRARKVLHDNQTCDNSRIATLETASTAARILRT